MQKINNKLFKKNNLFRNLIHPPPRYEKKRLFVQTFMIDDYWQRNGDIVRVGRD